MIGVIVNPRARGARDPLLPERLRQVLRGQGVAPAEGEVVVTRTREDLRGVMEGFAARGVDLVAVCGGDGTAMATVTAMVRAYGAGRRPRLLLLRGGTINTVAGNLGVRGRPEELLRRGLGAGSRWQDLIRVRSVPGAGAGGDAAGEAGGEDLYGFLFAAAMGARFLQVYYERPGAGPLWAAQLTARTIGSTIVGGPLARRLFADTEARLHVDGAKVPAERFRLLLCATVADVGLGMRVTWRGGRDPGRFHVVASGLPLWSMAAQLPRVYAGRPLLGQPHLDQPARDVRMEFPKEQPFTLDGDLFLAREIDISIGPRIAIVA